MYYGLIIISVVLFGGCFALNDVFQKQCGSSLKASLQFSLLSAVTGLIVLLAVNGFKIEFTLFTLLLSIAAALSGFGFTFCAFKALGMINLSLFSLFSMLGGMVLPFVQGILFYGEKITAAKIVCFVLICTALLLTVERSEKKKGTVYYIGIFLLNGMSGVLSKFFTEAPYEKTSAAGYSIWCCICTAVIAAALLPLFVKNHADAVKISMPALGAGMLNGIANKIANYILVVALMHVDASVQYPMVTGGVMIASTIICFFGKNKPSRKEVVSVLIAFVGLLALFVIPV